VTRALFDCLNPECWYPGEEAELPPELDPAADVEGAQTDWPLCGECLYPLTLAEIVVPDEETLLANARQAFEQGGIAALRRQRPICASMIFEARQNGGEAE
jgi:hypothetical protein